MVNGDNMVIDGDNMVDTLWSFVDVAMEHHHFVAGKTHCKSGHFINSYVKLLEGNDLTTTEPSESTGFYREIIPFYG